MVRIPPDDLLELGGAREAPEGRLLGTYHEPSDGPSSAAGQALLLAVRRRQKLIVGAVGMAFLCDSMMLIMVVPMLPSLLPAAATGAGAHRELALALLFSAKELTQCVCAPLAGALTVHAGARVTLTASLLGLAAATVAFANASTYSALVVTRLIQGATSAALMSGGLTLLAQSHEPKRRTLAISQANAGFGLGAVLGPLLGGLGYERFGRQRTFLCVAALVALVALANGALHFAATAPAGLEAMGSRGGAGGEASLGRQLLVLLGHGHVLVVVLGIFAIDAAGGFFDSTFGLYLADQFNIGPARAAIVFTLEPLAYLGAVAALGACRLEDRVGKAVVAALGLGLVGLSLPTLTLGGARAAVVASMLSHGAGYGFFISVGHGLLADLVDLHDLSSIPMAFALADAAASLGYIVGPLAGTAISGALGARTFGLVCFGALCAALIAPTLALRGGGAALLPVAAAAKSEAHLDADDVSTTSGTATPMSSHHSDHDAASVVCDDL